MEYVNLIASIATSITAVTAVYVILEMRRHRRSGYLPKLLFEDIDLEIRQTYAGVITISEKEIQPTNNWHSTVIHGTNIGLGPAVNATAKWSYNLDEFVNQISALDHDQRFTIEKSDYSLSVSSELDYFPESAYFNYADEQYSTKVIMSMAQFASARWTVPLPSSYLGLYAIWIWLELRRVVEKGRNKSTPHIGYFSAPPPPLSLEITYADLSESMTTVHHTISFDIRCIVGPAPNSNEDRVASVTAQVRRRK